MKAHEWFKRGDKEDDPVEKFSNYWRGFNNLFFDFGNGPERQKIKYFLDRNISEEDAEKMLQTYKSEVAYLLSQPVRDMRGNGRDTGKYIENFMKATDSLSKIKELFMIIYQVRCNLEHGQKSPNRERDIQLCKSSSPLVAHVIDQSL